MFVTTHVTVCICHAELKSYLFTLLTYQGRNVLGRNVQGLTKRRNLHKSTHRSKSRFAETRFAETLTLTLTLTLISANREDTVTVQSQVLAGLQMMQL